MAYSDDISTAPDITSGGGEWDNLTATDNTGEPLNRISSSGNNIWQKAWLATAGTYVIQHEPVPADGFDTVMTLYTGPSGAGYADLIYQASDDDSSGFFKAKINYASPGGEWVYIESTGYGGARVSGQTTTIAPYDFSTRWVDARFSAGYTTSFTADMGVYTGPWPPLFPPVGAPDGRFHEVDFYLMLPNPNGLVEDAGDGSYDTWIYATYCQPAGATDPPAWTECGWYVDSRGPIYGSLTAPLPPVHTPGMHLFVSVYPTADTPPMETPESLVPANYAAGATNPQQWQAGHWIDEPAFTFDPPYPIPGLGAGTPAPGHSAPGWASVLPGGAGVLYSNKMVDNPSWGDPSYTYHTFPFPDTDNRTLDAAMLSGAQTAIDAVSYPLSGGAHPTIAIFDSQKHGELLTPAFVNINENQASITAGAVVLSAAGGLDQPVPPLMSTLFYGRDYASPVWDYHSNYYFDASTASLTGSQQFAVETLGFVAASPARTDTVAFDVKLYAVPHYPDVSTATLIGTMTLTGSFVSGVFTPAASTFTASLAGFAWPVTPSGGGHGAYLTINVLAVISTDPATFHVPDADPLASGDYTTSGGTVHSIDFSSGFDFTDMIYQALTSAWHYYHPGKLVPAPVAARESYLRMTQRNDNLGISQHPRLFAAVNLPNRPQSVQQPHAPRLPQNPNTYS